MGTKLPTADATPLVIGGNFVWYQGETFQVDIALNIKDRLGNPVDFAEGDTVTLTIFNACNTVVEELTYSVKPGDTGITLDMSAELSNKFSAGNYYYTIKYNGRYVKVLAKGNKIIVR